MNLYIYENHLAEALNPLALTRPVFDLRTGPFTFLERILHRVNGEVHLIVRPRLEALCREKHPGSGVNPATADEGIWLLGNVLWKREELDLILREEPALYVSNDIVVGGKLPADLGTRWLQEGGPRGQATLKGLPVKEIAVAHCRYLWTIVQAIPAVIQSDSTRFKLGIREDDFLKVQWVNSQSISVGNGTAIAPGAVLDASQGPLIIDENVKIGSLACLEGPLFIGSHSVVKPMTHISRAAVGPFTKVGGEVSQVIIQGYSNKVHYGYLGDSFIGEWVNLGAGTTTSNLKNNYSPVVVQVGRKAINTRTRHVGAFIGDHVKTAIGTVLNTGAVLGPGCMVVTPGFPPKTLRPFTWFVNGKHHVFNWEKFKETTIQVMERRGKSLTRVEKQVLKDIFNKR